VAIIGIYFHFAIHIENYFCHPRFGLFFCISRAFRVMDDDGSKTLSAEEFKKGVTDIGLELSDSEIDEMFTRLVIFNLNLNDK